MLRMMLKITAILLVVILLGLAALEYRQRQGIHRAIALFNDFEVEPVRDLGSTDSLSILPLIEYHGSDPALKTEVGVSYLIETDDHRILYDVGHNADNESPFPVPEGRIKLGPIDVQRRLASGDGLLSPVTMEEADAEIALLAERGLGIVGISGHDSSDEVIAHVAEVFGDRYRHIRVGEAILISNGADGLDHPK